MSYDVMRHGVTYVTYVTISDADSHLNDVIVRHVTPNDAGGRAMESNTEALRPRLSGSTEATSERKY